MDHFCIRYQAINNEEPAPYAKICKVIQGYGATSKEEALFYIQVSKDEEKPKWISMGKFLETVFKDRFEERGFAKRYLKLFEKASS